MDKGNRWCAVPGCMSVKVVKRHFFRFPKEYDRWLQWIEACKRMDLETKGPNYAYTNCVMCHLHFEEKWIVKKKAIRLHPDAIPSKFFGPAFNEESIQDETNSMLQTEFLPTQEEKKSRTVPAEIKTSFTECPVAQKGNEASDIQCQEKLVVDVNTKATPSRSHTSAQTVLETSRTKKLHTKILQLKKDNNRLRQRIKRLRQKEKRSRTLKDQPDIQPGINDKIFEALTVKLQPVAPIEKHCILCIDEMSLRAHSFYNVSQDEIIGFEDTGCEKSHRPTKSALVIMARSIAGNWEFPVCFYFVDTTYRSIVLKNILFEIIIKLRNCGAAVHAIVTDIGSNFVQLSRELGISTQNSTFLVEEEEVFYIFDTPHLIKATRNNLLKYDVQFNNRIASWKHILAFYNRDSKQWIRMAPNLSKCHIDPNGFQKKRIKYAVQIFSNRVAAGMCTQMSSGFLESEAVGTIDFIDNFDKLFDMLNSSALRNPKEYAKVYTATEKQVQFLNNILNLLKNITVIDEDNVRDKVKCFECWQITIIAIMKLWDKLKSLNFPYLRTRQINQDCVENFFDTVRQQGGNSLNPTPIQFKRAFKKLFSINFLQH